jgi:cell division protein FtsB
MEMLFLETHNPLRLLGEWSGGDGFKIRELQTNAMKSLTLNPVDLKNLSLKQILIFFITLLLLLAGYSALFGEYGYFALRKAERRSQDYTQRIEQLKKENQVIKNEIRALKRDPTAIEKIAREELGLVREGEIKMAPAKPQEDSPKNPPAPDSHP